MAFIFPNPIPVFPNLPGLTYSIHKRPTFATLVSKAVSGREVTAPQQVYPLWEFELTIDFFKDQTQNITPWRDHAGRHDMMQLGQLYLACNGPYGEFYFDDDSDDSRMAQVIGTANGTTKAFTAVRTFGAGPLGTPEPVGGINTLDNVYVGGIPTDIQVTFAGNVVNFNSPPASGIITIDFSFYYLCRFLDESLDFEQFMKNLWTMKSLKFRSRKP